MRAASVELQQPVHGNVVSQLLSLLGAVISTHSALCCCCLVILFALQTASAAAAEASAAAAAAEGGKSWNVATLSARAAAAAARSRPASSAQAAAAQQAYDADVALEKQQWKLLCLQHADQMEQVMPMQPEAAALAAAPAVAAVVGPEQGQGQELAAISDQEAAAAADDDNDGRQRTQLSPAAAAVAASTALLSSTAARRHITAVHNPTPASGALLGQYGSLPSHPPVDSTTPGVRHPTVRPGLRFQQQLVSASAAAAAGLSGLPLVPARQVTSCRGCMSVQHAGIGGSSKAKCPVHGELQRCSAVAAAGGAGAADPAVAAAAAATEEAEDEGVSWQRGLGYDGVQLVEALRGLADELLGEEVRRLHSARVAHKKSNAKRRKQQLAQQQQQQQAGSVADVPIGAAAAQQSGYSADADSEAAGGEQGPGSGAVRQQGGGGARQPGMDPWSFVAAAVLLQEVAREAMSAGDSLLRHHTVAESLDRA